MVEPKKATEFNIIHFNDVYDIQESPNQRDNMVGGISRFVSAIDSFRPSLTPLVLFSGDLFSPSNLSNIYLGQQMVRPINECKVDAACFGNHDFDYDLAHVENLIKQTNFPWIMSNVKHKIHKYPLAHGIEYLILNHKNLKIGVMGLAEEEWLGLLSYSEEYIDYEDFVVCANRYIKKFKEEGCDLIIALTHMRTHNDQRLALETSGIDLILGGHDHIIFEKEVNKALIVKSGSNFKQFKILRVVLPDSDGSLSEEKKFEGESGFRLGKINVFSRLIDITTDFPPHKGLEEYVEKYMKELILKKAQVIFYKKLSLKRKNNLEFK